MLDCVPISSNPPAWKRLISSALSTNERIDLIVSMFSDRYEVEAFKYLSGNDAQAFVDVIYEVGARILRHHRMGLPIFLPVYQASESSGGLSPKFRRRCLRSLCEPCGHEALLPKSMSVPLCYDPTGTPQFSGMFADTWMGDYKGRKVAAKVLRTYLTSDFRAIRKVDCS